jgi:transketolase
MAASPRINGRNVTESYLADRAKFVRLETVRLSKIAGAGHYSSTFSAAELFAALYYGELHIRPNEPEWPDRDRFILSKGHAAIGLYPILADLGFFDRKLLDDYTRLGSPFGDHPDMKKIPGVDFSSGSLGHGLSVAVGMALAARVQGR